MRVLLGFLEGFTVIMECLKDGRSPYRGHGVRARALARVEGLTGLGLFRFGRRRLSLKGFGLFGL